MGEIGKHKCSSIVDHRIEKIIFTLWKYHVGIVFLKNSLL